VPDSINLVIRGIAIGTAGSALMDVWSAVLRRRFGIPTRSEPASKRLTAIQAAFRCMCPAVGWLDFRVDQAVGSSHASQGGEGLPRREVEVPVEAVCRHR
jgi:hypothetical protein